MPPRSTGRARVVDLHVLVRGRRASGDDLPDHKIRRRRPANRDPRGRRSGGAGRPGENATGHQQQENRRDEWKAPATRTKLRHGHLPGGGSWREVRRACRRRDAATHTALVRADRRSLPPRLTWGLTADAPAINGSHQAGSATALPAVPSTLARTLAPIQPRAGDMPWPAPRTHSAHRLDAATASWSASTSSRQRRAKRARGRSGLRRTRKTRRLGGGLASLFSSQRPRRPPGTAGPLPWQELLWLRSHPGRAFLIVAPLQAGLIAPGAAGILGVAYGLVLPLVLQPSALFVPFIGGFLAPRGSYLVGFLIGLVQGTFYSAGVILGTIREAKLETLPPQLATGVTPITRLDLVGSIVSIYVVCLLFGTVAAAFASWYRSFLRNSQMRAQQNRAIRDRQAREKAKEREREQRIADREARKSAPRKAAP